MRRGCATRAGRAAGLPPHPNVRSCSRLLEAEEKSAGLPPSPKGGKKTPPVSTGKRRAEAPAAASAAPTSTAGRKKRRDAAGVKIALDLVVREKAPTACAASLTSELLLLQEERVDVHNSTDRTLSLTGWKLKSIEGSQEFVFPEGFELAAGATVVVWSGPVRRQESGWRLQRAARDAPKPFSLSGLQEAPQPPDGPVVDARLRVEQQGRQCVGWLVSDESLPSCTLCGPHSLMSAAAVLVNPDGEEVSTVIGVVHDAQEVSASEAVADPAGGAAAGAAEVTAAEKPAGCVQM